MSRLLSRRMFTASALTVAALALSACGGSADAASDREIGTDLESIARLAKEEKKVALIAYPENWANYGESFKAFTAKYGVEVEVASPNASSAEELTAVKNLKGQKTQPDVLDIGFSFTGPAVSQGLVSSFTPSLADEVPDNLKDPDGNWLGAYYGVLSIGVDANKVDVPKTFQDLLDPQYKGKIAIGDPRDGASVLAAVTAAALANGGSMDDITPGIEFFQKLADAGQLVSSNSASQSLTTGEAAVTFDWNYNYSGITEELTASGVDLQVSVPSDGVFGNLYAQPLTIDSPQPNAGRLWIEWLLSDEGANIYATSGAVPARLQAMKEAGTLSKEAEAALPPAEILENINFPSIAQGEAANQSVADGWAAVAAAL
ncbi:extracellular solute-binding protein [Kineosporia babensis]|uniref:Extracellular solute-binding protein n=1 Tax=Kineosporia babensis TaxID=499548 RepID=A0A9X1NH54_9ACTN|nr:extracellular solute-binding protein [Kineosporia babensis]MCD5314962.1 extracellular solute-binding protein [Kineosporia babensis]